MIVSDLILPVIVAVMSFILGYILGSSTFAKDNEDEPGYIDLTINTKDEVLEVLRRNNEKTNPQ